MFLGTYSLTENVLPMNFVFIFAVREKRIQRTIRFEHLKMRDEIRWKRVEKDEGRNRGRSHRTNKIDRKEFVQRTRAHTHVACLFAANLVYFFGIEFKFLHVILLLLLWLSKCAVQSLNDDAFEQNINERKKYVKWEKVRMYKNKYAGSAVRAHPQFEYVQCTVYTQTQASAHSHWKREISDEAELDFHFHAYAHSLHEINNRLNKAWNSFIYSKRNILHIVCMWVRKRRWSKLRAKRWSGQRWIDV